MTLSDLSIERPVLTWMMTLSVLVFGVLGFARLGGKKLVAVVTVVAASCAPVVMPRPDGVAPEAGFAGRFRSGAKEG